MSTYMHLTEVKKAQKLPEEAKVGVCLTCSWWEVKEPRQASQAPLLSLCAQPQLKAAALVVSGSSGCNKWELQKGVDADAEAYAKKGESGSNSMSKRNRTATLLCRCARSPRPRG